MVLCYIDDIMIATRDIDEHLTILRDVLFSIKEEGLKLKPSKCEFLQTGAKYLGRVIEYGYMKPDPNHTQCLREWQKPKNQKQMLSFLGFCNYYSEFIYKYSDLVKHLREAANQSLIV